MKRFSMSWESDIAQHRDFSGSELPDCWDSDDLMTLANIAKDKRIASHVFMTEYNTQEVDAYGTAEIINQMSLTEIWDHIDENGDVEDLQLMKKRLWCYDPPSRKGEKNNLNNY